MPQVMPHSHTPKTCEKAILHLKSFVAIILLLIDGDNLSPPSFLEFVVDNWGYLFGSGYISETTVIEKPYLKF